MIRREIVPLGELMATRLGSVDPSQFPDEEFDYYSIPAFDTGRSSLVAGREIGSSKQIVQPGDVLLSRIVPHIRRAWVVKRNCGHRIIGSGEWIVFRSDRFFAPYLRHLLVSDTFHPEFMRTVSGVGGSLLRARPSNVARISICLPPLEEQRRIAAILDQAEALRAKRRQALAKLDTLGRSVFIETFERDGARWQECALEDIAELKTGFPFLSSDYVDSGVRLCRGANVLPGRIDWSDLAQFPSERAAEFSEYRLQKRDIVVAMDRPWISEGFKVATIDDDSTDALLVQRVARLRAHNAHSPQFLYGLLRSKSFTRHCRPTETTVPHISPTDFRSYRFRLPPSSVQERYQQAMSACNTLRRKMETSISEVDRAYAGLTSRAFRGEL